MPCPALPALLQLFTSVEDVELAAQLFKPHVIICPFLKDFVPSSIYERHTCLVVHPGLMGDKGPSSLDWAITEGKERWGVTVLQVGHTMSCDVAVSSLNHYS
jgi:putative two-component system hydrogenase maturation factor HypX/HoxX